MKKRIVLLAAAISLAAPAVWAAVNGTHHDMSAGNTATTEVCYYCHGAVDVNAVTEYGNVGALCVTRCHSGATGANFAAGFTALNPLPNIPRTANPTTDATVAPTATLDGIKVTNGTIYQGHGLNKASLHNPITGAALTNSLGTDGQALPYGGAGNTGSLECTSCHNVHDNTYTPFLQLDLFTGGANSTSFCQACHAERGADWDAGEVAATGEHPVNVTVATGAVATRTLSNRQGRTINFDKWTADAVFDVVSPNGAALNANNASYVTGGKVSGFGNVVSGTSKMGCYTCHSAHMPNNETSNAPENLVLRATVGGANNGANPLCTSCHGATAAGAVANINEQNPGNTAYFHPLGPASNAGTLVGGSTNVYTYTASTGSFVFNVNLNNIITYAAPSGLTNGGVGMDVTSFKLRCTSCHDVHGGVNNYYAAAANDGTMALADLDGTEDGAMGQIICNYCHNNNTSSADLDDDEGVTTTAAEAANSHHISGTSTNYTSAATFTDADGNVLNVDTASWYTAANEPGDLADGLQCADCHVFNKTAHNW